MSAAWVLEATDIFKEGGFDVPAGQSVSAPDQFGLRDFKKLSAAELSEQFPLPFIDAISSCLSRIFL